MKTGETLNSGKGRKISRIQERNSLDMLTEEVTETTFQRTRAIQRTPNKKDSDSDDMPQVEWREKNRYIQANTGNSGPSRSAVATAQSALVSFWDL